MPMVSVCFLPFDEVFEFDVGVAVLAVFEGLTTIDADGLLGARMYATEADGAVVADEGDKTALRADRRQTVLWTDRRQSDVVHRADTGACLATRAFVFIHHGMECT